VLDAVVITGCLSVVLAVVTEGRLPVVEVVVVVVVVDVLAGGGLGLAPA